MWTTMIARVRGVIRASTSAGSRQNVSSISAIVYARDDDLIPWPDA
jgi:hypothetical protein